MDGEVVLVCNTRDQRVVRWEPLDISRSLQRRYKYNNFLPQFLSVSLKLEMYCISLSIHERCVTASYQRSMPSPITELSQSGRTVALILTLSMI